MISRTTLKPEELGKVLNNDLNLSNSPEKLKKKIKLKKKLKKKSLKPKKNKAPLVVVKKTGEDAQDELEKWLATEAGFIEGLTSDVYDNPSRLYKYQIKYLEDDSYFIHVDKSRQTGFSYVYACRSLAKSHLSNHHTSIFISINQEEANEKIVYAKALHDTLPLSIQKKLVVDNKHALEFEAYNGAKTTRTRILSYAQREPRGKGGNVDVYLDEAAHYTWGDSIYVASVPIITRGSGTLTIGSTPLGKKGIHYEVANNSIYKKIYSYHLIYWWNCIEFVKPGTFKKAQREAPFMTTQERVVKFGSEKLMAIFISMDLDQFKQEYEIFHVDESVSFFPIDLINQCVYEIIIDDIFLMEEEDAGNALEFPIMEKYGDIDFKLYDEIEDLQKAVQSGKIKGKLLSGYDVGRKKHAGEFAIIEELGSDHDYLQIVRLLKTFKDTKFRIQKAYLKKALDSFSNIKMKIDSGGLGMNLGEDLSDYSWRVDAVEFTNQWKEEACSDFRIRLENQTIAIPNRKDVKNQIHSIKRKITEAGKFIFDAEKNNVHHGDLFWAINMASSLGEKPLKSHIMIPGNKRPIAVPQRIIPIAQARSFGNVHKPLFKGGILDVSSLRRPETITRLHQMGGY